MKHGIWMAARRGIVMLAFAMLVFTSCGLDTMLNPPAKNTTPVTVFSISSATGQRGEPITVDGSYSYDPQGESLTYAWTLGKPTGSSAALGSSTSAVTSFTMDKGGVYTVSLQVTNKSTKGSKVESKVVDCIGTGVNHPPVAIAPADFSTTSLVTTVLDGSASYDADSQSLTYTWTLIGTPSTSTAATLTNTSSKFSYLYPDVAGKYTIRLVVNDGTDYDEDYVVVTAS